MKWKWLLILVFSVNLAYLSLEGSEICGPRGQAFSTHLWWCLIYAASWMQLFCMSTALKSLGDADSLKKDWLPLVVFIWGACHQCVDWRWMFCFQFGGRGLLSFLNLGAPVGWDAAFHPFIRYPILLQFPPFFVPFLWSQKGGSSSLHPCLFTSPALRFISLSPPSFLPLTFLSVSHSRGQAPTLLAPCFPFDWPNSLFTSPRHKRHQADWSAGRSQGTTDQWGLGQRGGGGVRRMDGGERPAGEKVGGRSGQVGWQTHNQRANRWELLLSSDKSVLLVQDIQTDPHWQELLFPHSHELYASLGDTSTKPPQNWRKNLVQYIKQKDSIW